MLRSIALAGLCLIGAWRWASAAAAEPAPASRRVVTSAKLLEDVDFLRRAYEAAHPGLYRYNTRAQMDGHFARLRAEFARDRTLAEVYVALSQFLAKIRCGHTYANFFNQPKDVVDALFAGKNRVPFCFRWIDGRMIVTRDLSPAPRLRPGTEVLAIDGVPSSHILSRMLTVARADGSNDAKRSAILEVQGAARYEAFDVFLPLFFPAIGERMDLLIREPGSMSSVAITVDAQDMARREELARRDRDPRRGPDEPVWKFEPLDGRTVYLRMPSWALYNSRWDWKGFLDRGFDDLAERGVPGLIIDLRGNEGGLDVGGAIAGRIISREVRCDRYRRYTRYRTWPLPKSFDPCLDTWDWSFKDWGTSAREDRDGFFRMTRFDDDSRGDAIVPRGRRYEGRVVVLIGAANSSATFQFAQIVKENRLATLVGQTTGGNQRGINGSAFFFVTLPNSRVEVDLPLVGNFVGDERPAGQRIPFESIPDAGIMPDVPIVPRIEDIAGGVDPELRAAKAIIAGPG